MDKFTPEQIEYLEKTITLDKCDGKISIYSVNANIGTVRGDVCIVRGNVDEVHGNVDKMSYARDRFYASSMTEDN